MSNHAGESKEPIYDETVEAQGFDPANPGAALRAAPIALPEAPPAAKASPKPKPGRQPRNG